MFFKRISNFTEMSSSNTLYMLTVLYIFTTFHDITLAEDCGFVNDCKCQFQNGSVVDISSLGFKNQPRWMNVKPTNPNDNYTYSFNPCPKFSIANSKCQDAYVCKSGADGWHNCGDKMTPNWNDTFKSLSFNYIDLAEDRITHVKLVCSPEAQTPTLVVMGITAGRLQTYEMTLTSKCACADLCKEEKESHLSTGSVLVILFFIFLAIYLVFGIIHSSLTRGAHGFELIPNYEFWMEFPLLVRDGCVFVVNGCKPDTAYERI